MNVNYFSFPRLYRYVHEAEHKAIQAFLLTFLAENVPKKNWQGVFASFYQTRVRIALDSEHSLFFVLIRSSYGFKNSVSTACIASYGQGR